MGIIAPSFGSRTTVRELQLTFDDGPEPVHSALTPILKEIATRSVLAAFFVLGEEVSRTRSALSDIRAAGHVIGNHSWDHMMPETARFSDDDVYRQFDRTHGEVKRAGYEMQHWRAPRGEAIQRIEGLIVRPAAPRRPIYRLSHCDWHADSKDALSSRTAAQMIDSIERDFQRQGQRQSWRLLFHVVPHTADALKAVLDHLSSKGNRFVDFAQST